LAEDASTESVSASVRSCMRHNSNLGEG
jgi:hypothetical protein